MFKQSQLAQLPLVTLQTPLRKTVRDLEALRIPLIAMLIGRFGEYHGGFGGR